MSGERVSVPPHGRWAVALACSRTGATAELDAPAFLSPAGAPWLVRYRLDPAWAPALRRRWRRRPFSLWRYRELLPVADPGAAPDLGAGGTPLLPVRRSGPPGVEAWIKDEGANPTGSFKARGLAVAVARARELGAPGVELPSAGNAAVALAAYAAAAGLPARVALPADTPQRIVRACRTFGAEVLRVGATLVEAGHALAERGGGFWNLATLREPYRLEGKKTLALELAEQCAGRLPDWIVYPTGGGTGLIGMHKAFAELRALGLLDGREPRLAAVQMAGCAPIVRAFEAGVGAAEPWALPRTRVWGLRVPRAIGDVLMLAALRESGGTAVAVDEGEPSRAARLLARREGILVGPEGAAAWAGLERLAAAGIVRPGETAVVFQTGHPGTYR